MTERKQDVWRVVVNYRDENRSFPPKRRVEGIVDLPRPMVALDAADHALRAAVAMADESEPYIKVDVWGRADIGSEPQRLCSAVAEYAAGLGKYMRYTPWETRMTHQDIGEPEGAVIVAFE